MDNVLEDHVEISHEAEAFYSEIRSLVVVFLFFVILFGIAHWTLRYFFHTASSTDGFNLNRTDYVIRQLVQGMCTFVLTVCLAGYSLIPVSIIVSDMFWGFSESYYTQWLNADLVNDLTLLVDFGIKISFGLLPASYFVLISQGFSHSPNPSFASRLLEALCLLFFTFILVFGTLWSAGTFLVALHALLIDDSEQMSSQYNVFSTYPICFFLHSIRTLTYTDFLLRFLPRLFVRTLELAHLVTSLAGLLLLFACMPVGLLNIGCYLLTNCTHSLPVLLSQKSLHSELLDLQFTALCIEEDIQTILLSQKTIPLSIEPHTLLLCKRMHAPFSNDYCAVLNVLRDVLLPEIRCKIKRLKYRLSHRYLAGFREIFKPLTLVMSMLLILGLLRLVQSFVFFNILGILRDLLFSNHQLSFYTDHPVDIIQASDGTTDATSTSGTSKSALFGQQPPASYLGHLGAAIQICIVHFLLVLSLWGFYTIPATNFFRPRAHSMNLDTIMINITVLLLFICALPLQTNLLGLTTLTLPSAFKNTDHSSFSDRKNSCTLLPVSALSTAMVGMVQNNVSRCTAPLKSATQADEASNNWSIWRFLYSPSIVTQSSISSPLMENMTQNNIFIAESLNKSILSQFLSRAFGVSPSSSPSYELGLIILLYNLGFLFTSFWIAGRSLGTATMSISLEVVTSIRCLQRLSLTSTASPTHSRPLAVDVMHTNEHDGAIVSM